MRKPHEKAKLPLPLAEGGWRVFSTVISTGGRRHPLGFPGYSPLRMPPEPSKDNLPEPVISCSASTKTQFSSVAVVSDSLRPRGLQHTWLPCPSPTPRAFSNSYPSSW